MRIRSGLAVVLACGTMFAIAQGCAASTPAVADEEDSAPPVPTTTDAARDTSPPKTDSAVPDTATPPVPDAPPPDTSVPDARDSATDSAVLGPRDGELFDPTAPKPGDPCPVGVPENTVVSRRCGKCGNQNALCETGRIVGTYGACTGEKVGANACLPRERLLADCGFCGKQPKDCDLSCSYVEGACTGEVAGGCVANEVTYITGVCPDPADVRKQTCSATCTKGAPEPCAPRPIDEIVVSQTARTTVSGEFSVITPKIGTLTTGVCPRTVTSTLTSYEYVRVINTGADSVNVSIANAIPSGATTKPSVVAALYPGPNAPADRQVCTGSVNSAGTFNSVNIPAGGSVVFHANLSSTTATATKLKTDVTTNFIGPEVAPTPDYIVPLSLTMGTTVTQPVTFVSTQLTERPTSGACPATLNALTASRYVRITNADAVPRVVDVSAATGLDTIMGIFPGPDGPLSANRGMCVGSINDYCSGAVAGADSCVTNVSVPAGGSVVALVQQYSTTLGGPTTVSVTTKN